MFESHEQTPQQDVSLYRFDGRLYEISQTDESLTLRLRPSVVLEKRITAGIVLSVLVVLFLVCLADLEGWIPQALQDFQIPIILVLFPTLFAVTLYWLRLFNHDRSWEFQKYSGKLHARRNGELSIELPELDRLLAWERNGKFYLAILIPNRKALRLGSFGFATKERSWLDDAGQIAAFLAIGLEVQSKQTVSAR